MKGKAGGDTSRTRNDTVVRRKRGKGIHKGSNCTVRGVMEV